MFRPPSKPNPSQQSTPVSEPMDKYTPGMPSNPRPTFSKSKCERFLLFGLGLGRKDYFGLGKQRW